MSGPVRIAVAGASGRMGRAVVEAAGVEPRVALSGAWGRAGDHMREGALAQAQVVIDVSTAAACAALATELAQRGGPALVAGATGFSDAESRALERAAERIPVLRAGNFSPGVALLARLVREAAAALGPDYDIEILEAHHRGKADAPSGTALMLGEAAAAGRGVEFAAAAERGRDGIVGPRTPGAIGFASLRGGAIVGEHSVMFAGDDEVITLGHSALDRGLFARGALHAALWLAAPGRAPGLYGMEDTLGGR